ncbi:MAG: APC family permease [Lachnospiraceae bacterium]|nr:APC family permease [Lachnospiraceae bacterium]
MGNELKEKYGLPTAICMIVGTVIGSGVFFKAETVLNKTGGNMPLGILAWLLVGAIMVICSYVFAKMSIHYNSADGLVGYADATMGKRYGYMIGWFMTVIYTPALVSVLSWVSARYTCVLLGWDITGGSCMTIACFYLCMCYVMNTIAPKLAGKFQVSTTIIKLIPLGLMAIVGTIMSFGNGRMAENIASMGSASVSAGTGLMGAMVAVAFAYEGWILSVSIKKELKNAEKNLPFALIIGSFIVVLTYVLYYIGINGVVAPADLMASGEAAAKLAFTRMLGDKLGSMLFVLIVISCLGTLNGLTLACCRGMYALAKRGEGPNPKLFAHVDPESDMPTNSCTISLAFNAFWLLYFYGANLSTGWFAPFNFDSSELPIITLYAMYIPMFVQFMRQAKELNSLQRFVMPSLGLVGCVFMCYAAISAYQIKVAYYLIVFAVVMVVGMMMYKKKTIE